MPRSLDINRYSIHLYDLAQEFQRDVNLVKVLEFPDRAAALGYTRDVYGFQRAITAYGNSLVLGTTKGPKGADRITRTKGALTPRYEELMGILGVRVFMCESEGKHYLTLRHADSPDMKPQEVPAVPTPKRKRK